MSQSKLRTLTLLSLGFAPMACSPSESGNAGGDSEASESSGGSESQAPGTAAPGTTGTSPSGSTTGEGGETGSGAADESETSPLQNCDSEELSDMYTRYVEPFVSGAVLQSCSSCHMTGVDMSIYAQDTPCNTMACMVNQGVVDLNAPAESSLLTMIEMGDPESSVFEVSAEHGAMLEWIEWSAQCHTQVCGELSDACDSGEGTPSTGVNPIGDCSEDDLTAVFWDKVLVDRGRCLTCHSSWGYEEGTFGACAAQSDCNDPQSCIEGFCRAPGPLTAPHFFEGVDGPLDYENPAHRELGRNTMYNIVAMDLIDVENPLDSLLLTKPLLEDFQPTAVYGDGVTMPTVASPDGVGVVHGGTSKFNFECHEPPCPESGVVDCRTDVRCGGDNPCPDGTTCQEGMCRMPGSYCDETYTRYVEFVEYFAECSQGG